MAEHVTHLRAICEWCCIGGGGASEAAFSIIRPEVYNSERITIPPPRRNARQELVGGHEIYQVVCRNVFNNTTITITIFIKNLLEFLLQQQQIRKIFCGGRGGGGKGPPSPPMVPPNPGWGAPTPSLCGGDM